MFFLALGVLSGFFMLAPIGYVYRFVTTGQPEEFGMFGVVTTGFTTIYWGLYFWAKKNTPIKIVDSGKELTTFHFANAEFANEFRAINSNAS